mmetsp:Transcript_10327/g.16321  ORF Transcript_10327/g.16321 Transcript_10327/m.16321 type:complete len:105 (+) Transcript_10327:298-612(+)
MFEIAKDSEDSTSDIRGLSLETPDQQFLISSFTVSGQRAFTTGRSPPAQTTLSRSSGEVTNGNGLVHAHISQSKTPKEYTSAAVRYPWESATSGAMYRGVPHFS